MPYGTAATRELTTAALDAALSKGAIPVTMGGDGAISLPEMRALHRRHPDLAVVHVDAHTDAYPIEGYNTATAFSRAFDEGLVDTRRYKENDQSWHHR